MVLTFECNVNLAARFDHLNAVIWLIESEGCSPTERAKNGITPLHLAAARGSINVTRWLSQHDTRLAHICTRITVILHPG